MRADLPFCADAGLMQLKVALAQIRVIWSWRWD
jgi:hypothetical protein